MPLPSRQNELYSRVMKDLREKFFPGAVLPTEPVYARELGCGRTTLRKVLARLEEENRIRRTHSGTFVLDESSGAFPEDFSSAERPVYLLLPCADYVDIIDRYSLDITRTFMAGAMRGAIESGRQLVTLPISEHNVDNHIECVEVAWSQISLLQKGDDVIFLGRWFRRVVPALLRMQCRFTYISQLPWPFLDQEHFGGWIGFSNVAFMMPAMKILAEQLHAGSRMGCLWFSLDQEEITVVERNFRKMSEETGFTGFLETVPYHSTPEEKLQALRHLLDHGQMEAVILCPHLRQVPWPAETAELLRDTFLIMDEHDMTFSHLEKLPHWIGKDCLFDNARMLTKQLLSGEYRLQNLYPYQFVRNRSMKNEQ